MSSQALLQARALAVASKPIQWDSYTVLGLNEETLKFCRGISGYRSEAAGSAESNATNHGNQKCKNRINQSDREDAEYLALGLVQLSPMKALNHRNLRILAELIVCASRHREGPWSSVERVLNEWKRIIRAKYGRGRIAETAERLEIGDGAMQERPDSVAVAAVPGLEVVSTFHHPGEEAPAAQGTSVVDRSVGEMVVEASNLENVESSERPEQEQPQLGWTASLRLLSAHGMMRVLKRQQDRFQFQARHVRHSGGNAVARARMIIKRRTRAVRRMVESLGAAMAQNVDMTRPLRVLSLMRRSIRINTETFFHSGYGRSRAMQQALQEGFRVMARRAPKWAPPCSVGPPTSLQDEVKQGT